MLVLTVVSATAWAQPSSPASVTAKAQEVSAVAARRVTQLATQRTVLATKYEGELRAIDRVKQQRRSWRRDRELQELLSAANETAKQLASVTRTLAGAQTQLAGARRVLVAAIDAELAAGAPAPRARLLAKLRARLVPQVRRSPQRIVIPNFEVDLNADPEDLEEQAAVLRESEAALQRQIIGLEKQGNELDRIADLRKNHDRASILDRRDDDQPTRNVQQPSGRGGAFEATDSASPSPPSDPSSGGPEEMRDSPQAFESEASVVLADVVDPTTLAGVARAQRSGDPKQRAAAVKKTRDAVQHRLDQLRKKRALIEKRARELRRR